jgi:hypothetical protein
MPPAPDLTLELCTHAVMLAGRLNGGFKGNAKSVERADFRSRLARCVQPLPRRFKATVNGRCLIFPFVQPARAISTPMRRIRQGFGSSEGRAVRPGRLPERAAKSLKSLDFLTWAMRRVI